VELIFCADGNPEYARLAIEAGFTYGAQLPNKIYYQPDFVDQDWRNPDRGQYLMALSQYQPRLATVLDWERRGQLPEVLGWAEDAAQFVDVVIIIPKVKAGVARLPFKIGGKPVRLAFSYPTGFGGADWSILYEMIGWPNGIHLLGGPPQAALALHAGRLKMSRHKTRQPDFFTSALDIRSADSNQIMYLANRGLFWRGNSDGTFAEHISIKQADGEKWGDGSSNANANYECFKRSCQNVMAAWSLRTHRPPVARLTPQGLVTRPTKLGGG
jgi:hypothetical protein